MSVLSLVDPHCSNTSPVGPSAPQELDWRVAYPEVARCIIMHQSKINVRLHTYALLSRSHTNTLHTRARAHTHTNLLVVHGEMMEKVEPETKGGWVSGWPNFRYYTYTEIQRLIIFTKKNKGASAWGWSLFFFSFDLRSKSVEAIVARFASKKLDSRFLLALLELPPKSCTAGEQEHEIKPCGLVLYWRQ